MCDFQEHSASETGFEMDTQVEGSDGTEYSETAAFDASEETQEWTKEPQSHTDAEPTEKADSKDEEWQGEESDGDAAREQASQESQDSHEHPPEQSTETEDERNQTYENLAMAQEDSMLIEGSQDGEEGQEHSVVQNGQKDTSTVVPGDQDPDEKELNGELSTGMHHNGSVNEAQSFEDQDGEGIEEHLEEEVEWLEEALSDDGSQPQDDVDAALSMLDDGTLSDTESSNNSTDDLLRLLGDDTEKIEKKKVGTEKPKSIPTNIIVQKSPAQYVKNNIEWLPERPHQKIKTNIPILNKMSFVTSPAGRKTIAQTARIDKSKMAAVKTARAGVTNQNDKRPRRQVQILPEKKPRMIKFDHSARKAIALQDNCKSSNNLVSPEKKPGVADVGHSLSKPIVTQENRKTADELFAAMLREDAQMSMDDENSSFDDTDDMLDSMSSSCDEEQRAEYEFTLDLRGERASEFLPLLGKDALSLLQVQRERLLQIREQLSQERVSVRSQLRQTGDEAKNLRLQLMTLDKKLNELDD